MHVVADYYDGELRIAIAWPAEEIIGQGLAILSRNQGVELVDDDQQG